MQGHLLGDVRRLARRLLPVAVLATLVLAACADDPSDVPPNTAAATPIGSTSGTPAHEPADGSADPAPTLDPSSSAANGATTPATRGGTLRYAYPTSPVRLDPHRALSGGDMRVLMHVFDRLIHVDADGALIPGLATSWEFSDDGLTLHLTLRTGVTFQDGTDFDATAVKANIERGQTISESTVTGDLGTITDIRVIDNHNVDLILSSPDAVLPSLLAGRAGAMISPAAFDTDLDTAPVGAGPYQVTEFRRDDEIVFERFADYWDPTFGGPDRVEWRIVTDESARLNGLRLGDLDVALISGKQVDEANAIGLDVFRHLTLSFETMLFNRSRSEFGNPLVRQAISHAIDRQALLDTMAAGAGTPTVQEFPVGNVAHNADYPADYYDFDPQKARDLLAEAGLPEGFTFELLVPALESSELGAELMQHMLADVGITVSLRLVDPSQASALMFSRHDSDALFAQFPGQADPQITMDVQYLPTGARNAGGDSTPRYVELSNQARAATDPDERAAILREMVAEVVQQAFTVPLAHDDIVFGLSDRVHGLDVLPGGELSLRNVSVEH